MTTEDDFNAALDACPDDWQTRLVFADWLDERGDPRAEGYRALVANDIVPYLDGAAGYVFSHRGNRHYPSWLKGTSDYRDMTADQCYGLARCCTPRDWFAAVAIGDSDYARTPCQSWRAFKNRRAAEDAAALAFAELPAERRAELLRNIPLENLHSGVANSLTSGVG
jgi:uncharacterized protein (TIGR02996 family)